MRIGIGLNLLAPENGGATNYVLTLLRHWPQFAPEHPLVLFSFAHNESLLSTLPAASRQHEVRLQTQEEAVEHFDKLEVYFCPFGSLWPRPVRKPTVLTFHDMQERFYPQFFTPAELRERFYHYDWSLRMADAVIAVSEFTRQSAVRLAGASRRKVRVVHHVPDELPPPHPPAAFSRPDAPPRFVFYPANFWPHKNQGRLLAGFAAAREACPNLALVCTGSLRGREVEWREALRASGLTHEVLHLGRVTRSEISWLYQHARALVFPSLFEGFGIPLLEAMQSGCPIACGDNTSQPDVARDAALYFDANEPRAIAAAITRIETDEPLRARLIASGRKRMADFTVQRFIDGHLTAFELAVRRHNPLRAWINEHVRLPRSTRLRSALTRREIRIAQNLLSTCSRLPHAYERAVGLPA